MLVILALAACSHLRPGPAACAPDFPFQNGWLGGDGAASVDLGRGHTLWLFGDTFVGGPDAENREGAALIANSAAISGCGGGRPAIRYFWAEGPGGPGPIFAGPEPGIRVWPLAGLLVEDTLLVTLLRVRTTDAGNPLGFALEGVDLARVSNWRAPPAEWEPRTVPLTRAEGFVPGAGLLESEGGLLLFAPYFAKADEPGQLLLARLSLGQALSSNAPAPEFWAGAGKGFVPGLGLKAAAAIGADVPVELSAGAVEGHYLLAAGEPGIGGARVLIRRAPAPEGPWSAPEPAGRMAEADLDGVFCYGGKAHFQYRRPGGQILLTYACNALDPARLLRDMTLYRPKTLWIDPGLRAER